MATYKIDPLHSEVMFKVKHLMIANVTGHFAKFDATMESSEKDFSNAKIYFEADVDSISTNNDQRDNHLKSDDFFNAEKFPKLIFKSTGSKKINNEEYIIPGNMTIRDITKPVELRVTYEGTTTDFYGQTKVGFEITGKINRKEFGLKWHAITETGSIVVSDDVRLQVSVQMVKQVSVAQAELVA